MRALLTLVAALLLTVASAWIRPTTDEHAMYGWEGPPGLNYKPRPLAGWPAPFIADSPHTSVIMQIGIEDDFRPGPFLASLSFWLLIVLALGRAVRRIRHD